MWYTGRMNLIKILTNWRFPYRAFPFISAGAWTLTISFLLVYWLANGRPIFPSQSQPRIAYISDIGGFRLKPLFITGCAVTIGAFWVTLLRIHFLWSQRLQRLNLIFGRVCSGAAVVSGIAAGLGLVLVSVLDVYHFRVVHIVFLHIFCAGMLFTATFTVVTDLLLRHPKRIDHRSATRINSAEFKNFVIYGLLVSEWVLVIIFVALFAHKFLFLVGILEWVIAYLLVPYLALTSIYMDQDGYLPLQDGLPCFDQISLELPTLTV
ncbi:hypothetical protein PT974_03144 [Cladobotryum mycophilum]|uniref:CWH43-like N-terminal domain-containing protein n=1 Tax=Cladobotryum mycophilum TaxID=491253 RepID=A0ABR0SSQ4_9HYPO